MLVILPKITGDYEIQFTLLVRDSDELIEFNKKIIPLLGIEKI